MNKLLHFLQMNIVDTSSPRPDLEGGLRWSSIQARRWILAADESKSSSLKDKLHAKAESLEEPSRVRVHRAISWLARAESESEDQDAQFLF